MIAFRKQAYFLPCFRERVLSCILFLPGKGGKEKGAEEAVDFSGTIDNDPFMMKLFCMVLLAGCICCGNARSGVRMVDVVENGTFARALEMINAQVRDSASCRKVVEELNREADRQEQLWREAFRTGEPTTREWCRLADADVQLFRKLAESREMEKKEKMLSFSDLENEEVITHEEAQEGFAALRRLA